MSLNHAPFLIREIRSQRLNVPFHPRSAHTVDVRVPTWSVVDLYRVTLSSGAVGIGETIDNYTFGTISCERAQALVGRNAMELLWDDSLGAGVQMALFDAVGKTAGVPCHRLMGVQHRETCPVSWWAQDMPPELWAAEARSAVEHGFTTMKVKARPWFDIDAQLAALSDAVPDYFRLDADFNGLLLGVDHAAHIIGSLEEKYPVLAIVESPIPQEDVAGNALLRSKVRSPIAMHFGNPPAMTAIRGGVCDGFVISGGAGRVMSQGTLAEHASMPFWLQLVGTGLTTIWSCHLGSVLKQARWPAIPGVNIYEHTLVSLEFSGGHLRVPKGPGLGVELDEEAIARFEVAADFQKQLPREIHTIHWPDGRQDHYPDGSYRQDFLEGKLHPGFLPGIHTDRVLDNGSAEFDKHWRELFAR